MPWTDKDYPQSLKNFMAPVRRKAIDIANAIMEQDKDEGRAIAIATAQAEEWAKNRGMQVRKKNAPPVPSDNAPAKKTKKSKA